jgi:hypothetical protein
MTPNAPARPYEAWPAPVDVSTSSTHTEPGAGVNDDVCPSSHSRVSIDPDLAMTVPLLQGAPLAAATMT